MKRLFLILFALAQVTNAWAQTLLEELQQKRNEKKDGDTATVIQAPAPVIAIEQFTEGIAVRQFPDVTGYYAEYYQNITNKYGLWKGIGKPLGEEQRKHLSACYKLMRPANATPNSPFTHMQIVDFAGHLTTNISYKPYLDSDDGLTEDWNNRLGQVCQVEKIISKGILIQENMFDAKGHLVLQSIPTTVSDERIVVHYIAPDGLMPRLAKASQIIYSGIRLDSNGFVSQINLYDEYGELVRNDNDAFSRLYQFDAKGNKTFCGSGDANGNPVIDDWGNCGYIYTYDGQGRMLTATCVDEKGQPMKMPTRKKGASGTWIVKYSYNKWGNLTEQAYYDNNGQPDTNPQGIHRIAYTYNNHGQTTSYRAENEQHQLVNNDNGYATYERQFDKNGNLTKIVYRDEQGYLYYKRVHHSEIDTTWRYGDGYMNLTWEEGNPGEDNYTNNSAQLYFDAIGDIGRTIRADAFYYKTVKTKDAQGNSLSIRFFNEFDEPAYYWSSEKPTGMILCYNDKENNHFDENGDTIQSSFSLKNKLFKACCIELTDSVGYRLGLRSGDLIVRYGDWLYTEPSSDAKSILNLLCYATAVNANTHKTVTVIRHNPKTKTSNLVSLELPPGTPEQLGFIYHTYYMTTRETERYRKVVSDAELDATTPENEGDDKVYFIIPYKIDARHRAVYDHILRSNAIVLAWECFKNGMPGFISYNTEDNAIGSPFKHSFDSIVLHYTVDGHTVHRCVMEKSNQNDLQYSYSKIPDGSTIYALSDSLEAAFNAVHSQSLSQIPILKPHEAAEQLMLLKGSVTKNSERYIRRYNSIYVNATEAIVTTADLDSLTTEEAVHVQQMLKRLDYSDYVYLEYVDQHGFACYDYVKMVKERIIEVVRTYSDKLLFITGDNIEIPHKTLPVINQDGYYVVLQYGEWHLGMATPDDFTKSISGPCQFIVAPLTDNAKKPLGKRRSLDLSGDIHIENLKVSDEVYFKALKLAKP